MINSLHPTIEAPLTHRSIKSAVKKVINGENAELDTLYFYFTNKKEIKKINNKFLKHNYYTDIITFQYNNSKEPVSGEIFMCIDVIKENAGKYGVSFKNEFERVIVHGCLHLTGYKDKTKRQKELIRRKENFYIS